jgi:hypothetical protein
MEAGGPGIYLNLEYEVVLQDRTQEQKVYPRLERKSLQFTS